MYLSGIIFVCIFSVAMLVPSYMISLARKTEVLSEFSTLKKSIDSKKNSDTESFISDAGQKIKTSLESVNDAYMSDVIREVLNNKTSDISINDISLVKNSKNLTVNISGIALTREGLLGFVKKLRSADQFKDVDLPVSNLAKYKDISFTLTLQSIF